MSALSRIWRQNARGRRQRDPRAMTGEEFEHYCADMLENREWKVSPTARSRDGGVDLIARKGKTCVAIQCKQQSSPVRLDAVQQAHFGKGLVNADFAAVVSSRGFTSDARRRAEQNRVILLSSAEVGALEERVQQLKPRSAMNWLAFGAGASLLLVAAATLSVPAYIPLGAQVLLDPQSGMYWFPRCLSQQGRTG